MKIKRVILRHLKMDLLHPFTTSLGKEVDRDFILVEIQDEDGRSGWAESVACADPFIKKKRLKQTGTLWRIFNSFASTERHSAS